MMKDEEFIIEAGRRPTKKRRNVKMVVSIVLCFVLSFVLVSVLYPAPYYAKASERSYAISNLMVGQYEYYVYTTVGIFILNKTKDSISLEPGNSLVLKTTNWDWCNEKCWPSHTSYKIYV
jgi:hypothetical protein